MARKLLPLALLLGGCAFPGYCLPIPGDRVIIETFPPTEAEVLWSEGTESLIGAARELKHGDCGTYVVDEHGHFMGRVVGAREKAPDLVLITRAR